MSRLSRLNPKFKPAFDGLKVAKDLLNKLQKERPVLEAYLFGSCAEGKNTEDSDVDLLIVIPKMASVKDYYSVVNRPLFSSVAVDWIFVTENDFLKDREIGGISRVAFLTGIRMISNGTTE